MKSYKYGLVQDGKLVSRSMTKENITKEMNYRKKHLNTEAKYKIIRLYDPQFKAE